ncbi:DUF6515 family protein [Puia sp. P3]|uniref:DUF6515 family protein n=1 Tax=Puia sp. P3 TaxID=3423952 RepID=UPI003D66F876
MGHRLLRGLRAGIRLWGIRGLLVGGPPAGGNPRASHRPQGWSSGRAPYTRPPHRWDGRNYYTYHGYYYHPYRPYVYGPALASVRLFYRGCVCGRGGGGVERCRLPV